MLVVSWFRESTIILFNFFNFSLLALFCYFHLRYSLICRNWYEKKVSHIFYYCIINLTYLRMWVNFFLYQTSWLASEDNVQQLSNKKLSLQYKITLQNATIYCKFCTFSWYNLGYVNLIFVEFATIRVRSSHKSYFCWN